MANLLNLKNRIRSVKNIGQVTKAMELVAAAKMRKAQMRAIDARQYSQELEKLVKKLAAGSDISNFDFIKTNSNATKNLLIIIGPSKGSVGSLISNLSRETYNYLKQNTDTDIISIDKKGSYIAEKTGKKIVGVISTIKTSVQEDDLSAVNKIIQEEYKNGTYKSVSIIFTHFINTLVQKPTTVQILPVVIPDRNTSTKQEESETSDFIIEPEKSFVINNLLQKYLENKLFVSVLDSISSEYSARMIAMKNASDNAKELKADLTLEYNQTRQAAITQQILEIAGATAAMEE